MPFQSQRIKIERVDELLLTDSKRRVGSLIDEGGESAHPRAAEPQRLGKVYAEAVTCICRGIRGVRGEDYIEGFGQ